MSRNQSSIIRGFLSILFGKVGIIVVSLFFTPIIVRVLGAESYGDYAYVLSLISIFTLISNFGFNDGVRKYIAERPTNRKRTYSIYIFYLKGSLLISIIFAIALSLWVQLEVGFLIPKKYHEYVYILCVIIVSNQIFQISRYGLMGIGKETYSESLNVTFRIGSATLGVLLAVYGLGVSGVLAGHLLSLLFVGAIAFSLVRKLTETGASQSSLDRRKLVTYGLSSFLLIFLTSSLYHVDVLLLGTYNGGEGLEYYKAALAVAELLWFVPQSVQTVLLHSTSAIWKERNLSKITDMTSTAVRFTLVTTLLLTVGLLVLSEEFVTVYFGEGFIPTVRPLMILLPGVLFFGLSRPIFAVGQGSGSLRLLILATLFAAVLNLVLNVLLIPRLGIEGAAIATSISYGSMIIFHTLAALRMGYNPVSDVRILRTAICGVITYLLLDKLNGIISGDILSIFIVAVAGGIVYVTLVLLVGSVSIVEIRRVLSQRYDD